MLIDILKELFSLLPYSCSIFVFNGYYREFKEDSWDTCFYILDNQEWNFISTLIFYYFNVFYSLDLLYDSLDTCGEEKVLGILLWVYFRCFRNSIFVLMMFICYSVFFSLIVFKKNMRSQLTGYLSAKQNFISVLIGQREVDEPLFSVFHTYVSTSFY